jgi:hypothetical protein
MVARSSSFSAKEFVSKLSKDDFDIPLTLTGMAKSSEGSSSDFLFVIGTRCGDWVSVPIDMVEHVEVLGTVSCDDHLHQRVTLTFKTPKSPDAVAFAALLGAAVKGTQGRGVVHKGGRGSGSKPAATFADCGCSEYEIDLEGHLHELLSVTKFKDGSCICDYS